MEAKLYTPEEHAHMMGAEISRFPGMFSLRGFFGHVFRINVQTSFYPSAASDVPMLYTEIARDGEWYDFAKGTPADLRGQMIPINPKRLDHAWDWVTENHPELVGRPTAFDAKVAMVVADGELLDGKILNLGGR
jgi:hypothetical protein